MGRLGHPLRRREYRTDHDRLLFDIDEDRFWGESMRPRSIRRSDLMELLGKDLGELVHRDTDIQSIALNADHGELTLSNGETLSARLVVGADGVRSLVRESAFGAEQGKGHSLLAQASWRFIAPNPGIDCWTVWVGAVGMILLMPVDNAEVYGWAAVTRGTLAKDSVAELDRLSRTFPDRVRRTIALALARPDELYHSPLEEVRLRHWTKERAVLIGDAAHASAPVWAQGVALALEDAIVLAECLSADDRLPLALEAYERRRRPRIEHVQAMTDAMSKAAMLPTLLRNFMMPFVGPKRYRQTYEPLKTLP
jgi:2-polyprenyl-6-methoxyphenol hydroxylase-like FAD-dependent oxidoreductase